MSENELLSYLQTRIKEWRENGIPEGVDVDTEELDDCYTSVRVNWKKATITLTPVSEDETRFNNLLNGLEL